MLIGVPLLTLTLTAVEVPTFNAASYAFDTSECVPFVDVVVPQLHAYGEDVSVDLSTPSSQNSTFVTPTMSDAFAVTLTVPETVAPFAGAVIDVDGACVSPPPPA
jgi:hypothetical protein